jgi:hypothetical protein
VGGSGRAWRVLCSEEHHGTYASQNIIKVIIQKEYGMSGHVAGMGQMRNAYKIWLEDLKRKDHAQDLGVDGWMTLNGSYRNGLE